MLLAAEGVDRPARRHLVASSIEHEAVLNTVKALERRGWRATFLDVDASGIVVPDTLRAALGDEPAVVSVMHANNEIGTVQPVAQLAAVAREHGALFHTDAVQSVGKIPVDVRALGVDLLSLSGHKFGGPKGTGALWIRRGVRLSVYTTGGRQERGRRAGTENVPGLIGLGVAASLAARKLQAESTRLGALRDRLEQGILSRVPGTVRNGAAEPRVPNTSNIGFDRVEAESLLIALDLEGIAVSTGSACSSGTLEPSHVLRAMGLPGARTQNAIRFSLGSGNTVEQVDRLIGVLPGIVQKLRSLNGVNVRSQGPKVRRS
jgi:cysteine desulfurase